MVENTVEPVVAVDDTDVRHAVDQIYLAQLPTIFLTLVGYYLFLTTSHLFFIEESIRQPMALLSFGAAVLAALSYVAVVRKKVSPRYSHIFFLPMITLIMINVYAHVAMTKDIMQLSNGMLILLALSIALLHPLVYAVTVSVTIALYVSCLLDIGGDHVSHYAFMLVGGTVVSMLCFGQRYKTLVNLERLRITDRLQKDQLEALNRSVTAQMEEARKAAREAQRANEAKGVFLANTSHELRTPLTGVLGMMNLLERSQLNDEQAELVSAAQVSAKTLLTLINDILDLAKLDEGKLELKNTVFDAVEIGHRMADLMRPAAKEKGIALKVHAPDNEEYRLVGDPVRIGQIILNLVGNAIKFTDEGQVDITIAIEKGDSNLYRLAVSVEDTGVGFSKEEGARLFSRFEQVDGSERRRQAGAGLGLSICRELTSLMDGTIGAVSMPGVGSRFDFSVVLPKADGKYDDTPKSTTDVAALRALKLRVLLAEDNRINQMLIEKLISRYGWDLVIVNNGQEAVNTVGDAAAGGHGFDLVLMDVRMPVMDGKTAAREIRAMDGDVARVPIIALTANTMPEDIETYRAIGMNDVVAKPIDIEKLEQAVAAIFPE